MSPDCNLLGCNLLAKTQACMCFAKCCIAGLVVFNCLVKSASVLMCFLLLSSGLSLSLYIYIYACCRIGITLDGAKLMAKSSSPLMVQRKQVCCLANCKCCIVCLVVFAWSRVQRVLSSSGLVFFCHQVVSLSVYIYICLVQDRLLHPAEDPS